ncbi:threonine synthase [Tissierella sp.]|uniref:threonine synthase n=1 Tax=Tissierella sp. TaxID=41274 RepID=UPI0028A7635D|nr:threonine synthase [Tissierella sp.]
MKNNNLYCTNCKKVYSKETIDFRCEVCHEPLELEEVKIGKIKDGNILEQSMLERYEEFYPFLNIDRDITLGEGFTPLVESKEIANEYDLNGIYFKNEGQNPTWSFKDRGTITGVYRAIDLGYRRIGTVSSGNMATSIAAYGAKANLETIVLVKGDIADEKLKPIAIYGPKLIKVEGDYGRLYSESFKLGLENEIHFINSDVPYRVEGYKTIAFEICEQLKFNIPDYVIVPTSAGGNIRGIEKGFREFRNANIIDKIPKIICVQAAGCAPIYNAFHNNMINVERFQNPKTIAQAIQNPTPPSGNQVLRMIRKNGGTIVTVSEAEIINAQKRLARLGIFAQPASATSLAAAEKLKNINYIKAEDRVVCIVTASGLKYTAALEEHDLELMECRIEELDNIIRS